MKGKIKSFSLMFIMLFSLMLMSGNLKADSFELTTVSFNNEYEVGDKVILPDADFTINGNTYKAKKVVHFPNEKAYLLEELNLSEVGNYRVEYRVTLNDKLYTKSYEFKAILPKVSFGNEKSISSYGLDPTDYETNLIGQYVSLNRGDKFKYNKVVNLSKLSASDPFIEMYVMPSNGEGNKDVKNMYIELVDVYDENNVVKITANAVDDDGGSSNWWQTNLYLQGAFNDSDSIGIEWTSGNIHKNNEWGHYIPYSMYGLVNGLPGVGKNPFKMYFDLNTKRLFGPNGISDEYITDFSDESLYPKTWEGFTTGEVFINIYAENYSFNSFDFLITKLGLNDLSEEVNDNIGPKISIDYGSYTKETIPKGIVGHTYPIFKASAFDLYTKESNVDVRVFRNYYSSQRYEFNIKDGRFSTNETGNYYIEYTSYDRLNNKSVELVVVDVLSEGNELDFELDLNNVISESTVGEQIDIASYNITDVGVGETNMLIKAIHEDGKEVIVENNKFRPELSGKWTITYLLKDFLSQQVVREYNLNIIDSNDPVFIEDAILPKYIIAGFNYDLPILNAKDYIENETILSNVYVKDGENDFKLLDENVHKFAYDVSGKVFIKYVATSNTGSSEVLYEIPIVDVYEGINLNIAKYFDTENLTYNKSRNNIEFETNLNEDANFIFVNSLNVSDFQLRFSINALKNNFSELSFVLSDSINDHEKLTIKLLKDGNNANVYLNDNIIPFVLENVFNSNTEIYFKYNNLTNIFTLNNNQSIKVEGFNGFSSNKAYFKTELKNIESKSSIHILNINGQTISNDTVDLVRPELLLNGNYKSVYEIGELATVFKSASFDVLSPEVNATVTVRSPKGEYAKSIDGVELNNISPSENHQILLEEYGSYNILYTANDNNGSGLTRYTYTMFVDDTKGPNITLDNKNVKQAKVLDNLKISSAKANDNVDGEVKVYYYLVLPGGEIVAIDRTNLNYQVKVSGTYKIRYFSIDSSGNTTILENLVVVTK